MHKTLIKLAALAAALLIPTLNSAMGQDSSPATTDATRQELAKEIDAYIRQHPEVIFDTILNNSEKFLDTVNKAAAEAQRLASEREVQQEQARRLAEMQNPFKPQIDVSRPIRGPIDAPVIIVE